MGSDASRPLGSNEYYNMMCLAWETETGELN
jgi:hypothetical protein